MLNYIIMLLFVEFFNLLSNLKRKKKRATWKTHRGIQDDKWKFITLFVPFCLCNLSCSTLWETNLNLIFELYIRQNILMWNLVRFVLMQKILIYNFYNFLICLLWHIEAQNIFWNTWKSKVDKQKGKERVIFWL